MSEEAEERLYDVVLFGSTGFTGKFVAEELYRVQCEVRRSLRWAAAGRSEDKVQSYLEASGIEGIDVIAADVTDDASLEEMCSKATVLISCVGPYQLYGEPVIRACIKTKCHYVDITGEPYFMEKMRQEYSEAAREAGVLLVSACGFDSIPNDLGALYVQRQFHGELAYLDSYVTTTATCFHTGTWESFLRSIKSHRQLQALRRTKSEEPLPLPLYKMPNKGVLFYSDVMKKWALPFPGADKAVVYRSLKYRYEVEGAAPVSPHYLLHIYIHHMVFSTCCKVFVW
ncbi:Saccharopine dehydrogenase-like oxidoreductase [Geodia barretti]|uniref:Saccharopine dehydrogenase-like oxidoreductase n=1 Tax=Geodia barretti TaxID=519541 RepID=A0AA35RGN7_GEOBA|nr:Saccharopine dehydrogenase-like oxidoreductase [Geodia barretti]